MATHAALGFAALVLCGALFAQSGGDTKKPPAHDAFAPRVVTFLMYYGEAEKAMNLYTSVFKNSSIDKVERYGEGEEGPKGTFKLAHFTIEGAHFTCYDSPMKHPFTFTPAISLFVTCRSEAEIDEAFAKLSEGGEVLMPLSTEYPFAKKYAWCSDRFGVSWQLVLPKE